MASRINGTNNKTFVRKFLRLDAFVKMDDVLNEARVVLKLCGTSAHENVIVMLQNEMLINSLYYYFDIELCDHNLENYIKFLWKSMSLEKMILNSTNELIIDQLVLMKYI